jgi:HK97 gp10 family phage protein
MADLHIKGGKELNAILQQLPVSIEKNILRSALRAGAKQIQQKAIALAPTDDGDLKASIRLSTGYKNGRVTAKVKVGNKRIFYARYVEFGVAAHLISKKDGVLSFNGFFAKNIEHGGYSARPFLRPSLDSEADNALRAIAKQIKKKLTKAGINTPDIVLDEVDNG